MWQELPYHHLKLQSMTKTNYNDNLRAQEKAQDEQDNNYQKLLKDSLPQ